MKIPYKNPWFMGLVAVIAIGSLWGWSHFRKSPSTTAPQTVRVAKGTLVQSVSGTGSLVAKIQADISAPTYGSIQQILVKNGDEVTADQPLFTIHSLASASDKAQALASLLSAQDNLNQARNKATTLHQSLTTAQQQLQDAQANEKIAQTTLTSSQLTYAKSKVDAQKSLTDAEKAVIDAASSQAKASTDLDVSAAQTGQESAGLALDATKIGNKQSVTAAQKTYQEAQRDAASTALKTQSSQSAYTAANQALQNQNVAIAASQATVTASQLNYQKLTNQTITSPISGRIVNMSLTQGATVGSSGSTNASSTSSSASTTTTNKLFSVIDFNSLRATIAVSEVDISAVKVGQAATLTFDALANKTFTGTVSSVDTVGTTTSGVTTYNVEIAMDTSSDELKPGMMVSASIITQQKNDVLLVPSAAISTQNGQSTAQVMKNGVVTVVSVTLGDSNETQTEVTSGLQAGDAVIINQSTTNAGSGAFSRQPPTGRGGGGGAGRGVIFSGGFGG